jgi:hypothetical protein
MTGAVVEAICAMQFIRLWPRVIIKLGTTGTLKGFDIDTSHFNGKYIARPSELGRLQTIRR